MGSVLHVHAQWVTHSPVPVGAIGQSLEGGLLLNIRKLFMKQPLKRSEQNFVPNLIMLGSVLHVHAQWVTPSPVPGGAIGQCLEGGLLLNIKKLFTKQPLERSEQNFVPNLIMLGSVLHLHAQWVTPSPVPGGAIGQCLEGDLLLNIRKLFTKQPLERSKQNFVTKFNHVGVCTACPCPMGYPQPGPRGRYRSKSEGKCNLRIKKVVHEAFPRNL